MKYFVLIAAVLLITIRACVCSSSSSIDQSAETNPAPTAIAVNSPLPSLQLEYLTLRIKVPQLRKLLAEAGLAIEETREGAGRETSLNWKIKGGGEVFVGTDDDADRIFQINAVLPVSDSELEQAIKLGAVLWQSANGGFYWGIGNERERDSAPKIFDEAAAASLQMFAERRARGHDYEPGSGVFFRRYDGDLVLLEAVDAWLAMKILPNDVEHETMRVRPSPKSAD